MSNGEEGAAPAAADPDAVTRDLAAHWTSRTSRFFRGKNLVHEVSFSCFYHHDTRNQVLHLASLAFILFGVHSLLLLVPMPAPLPAPTAVPLLPLVLALVYLGYFATLDTATACAWAVLLAATVGAAFEFRRSGVGRACMAPDGGAGTGTCAGYASVAVAAVVTIVSQLVGHVVFERRLPAFRLYEAAVLTPFFLVLQVLFWCGFKPDVRRAVYALAPQWAGTERRTF